MSLDDFVWFAKAALLATWLQNPLLIQKYKAQGYVQSLRNRIRQHAASGNIIQRARE